MSAGALTPDQIAALRALLAAHPTIVQDGVAGQTPALDTGIAGDDGTWRNPMCRVDGPFKDRNRWRVRVVDRETGKTKAYTYATEEEARAAIPKLNRLYTRPVGVKVSEALTEYERFMMTEGAKGKPNRPRTVATTIGRLRSLFVDGDVVTGEITRERGAEMWRSFIETPGPRSGKLPSVDTRVGVLKQSRTFLRWCERRGWLKVTGLLDEVKVPGERKRGKTKLKTKDESRRYLRTALDLGAQGDAGAVAAAMALLLGMRASEIADRTVEELDDGGRELVISAAKTDAGIRDLKIPSVLQPLLATLAKGKAPTDRLFGPKANRHWVLRAVRRICRAAGVSVITAHGMRGTHARLAVAAGVSGLAVAGSLGHESFAVTERHYAGSDAVADARVDRVIDALN